MFLIKVLCKVHSPQVLHGEGKPFAGKWVSKSFFTDLPAPCTLLTCLSKQIFGKEPDDRGRQVERVITQADTGKKDTNISSAQIKQKSQWIPTENPIQKSPCKRKHICYCRMSTGRCCHVDQRRALRLGMDGGTTGSARQQAMQRYLLCSHRGQRLSSTAGRLVLPQWCASCGP